LLSSCGMGSAFFWPGWPFFTYILFGLLFSCRGVEGKGASGPISSLGQALQCGLSEQWPRLGLERRQVHGQLAISPTQTALAIAAIRFAILN
jgi:hypothetical protein